MDIDLEIFSPVQQIKARLFDEHGIEVFVKRDDLIHPIISGNKWRKLKYILKKARDEQKTHLVTFGGAYSNHLLATAAFSSINSSILVSTFNISRLSVSLNRRSSFITL